MTTSDRFRRWIPRMFAAVRFVLIVLNNGGGNLRYVYAQNSLPMSSKTLCRNMSRPAKMGVRFCRCSAEPWSVAERNIFVTFP